MLFKESGLASSLNEARRAIAEGGAYVNNERVTDGDAEVPAERAAARTVPRCCAAASGHLAGVELRSSMM